MECACSVFLVNTSPCGALQKMFPTIPIHYFPPPGVHSFILSWGEEDRGGRLKKKHLVCGVMEVIAVELFLPTQKMAGGRCMLVERLRALSVFAL